MGVLQPDTKNNNGIITLSRPPKEIKSLFDSKIVVCSSKDIWDEITPKDDSDSEDLDKDEDEPNSVIYPILKVNKSTCTKSNICCFKKSFN